MDLFLAFILGVVQAITEFLPISSSAHLILLRRWLGFESIDGLTFDVAVHLGTVLALLVYFHRDLKRLSSAWLRGLRRPRRPDSIEERLAWYIIWASIPAALAGAFLGDIIEGVFRRPQVIVATLAAGGVLFLVVERAARQTRTFETMTLRMSLVIGAAQALALVPGVSRSGITIIAGMAQGLERAEAARFSFLLSVPIMLGAGAKKAIDLQELSLSAYEVAVLLVGVLTSAAVGWVVIRFFLTFLQRHKLDVFAYYRFVLAGAIFFWLAHH